MLSPRSVAGPRGRLVAGLLGGLLAGVAVETRGIEMFTFFGDGSRVGLPNLEVPVEAYPGIPLRSDRIRARRRAARQPAAQRGDQLPPGVTIRAMPAPQPVPQSAPLSRPVGPSRQAAPARVRSAAPRSAAPVAPSPDDILPPRGETN